MWFVHGALQALDIPTPRSMLSLFSYLEPAACIVASRADLLVPEPHRPPPKTLTITAHCYIEICCPHNLSPIRIEFRASFPCTGWPRSRTRRLERGWILKGESCLSLRAGYERDSPYVVVRLKHVAYDMPNTTLQNWRVTDVPSEARLAFLYIDKTEEIWNPRRSGLEHFPQRLL